MEKRITDSLLAKSVQVKPISYTRLIFEERVSLKCFQCRNYNVKWTCPPKIPRLDYAKILSECQTILLVYNVNPFEKKNYEIVRRNSSNQLHHALLAAEQLILEANHPLAISFTGGSCKLCTEGCDPVACRQPDKARIPLEAVGINVVKSAQNVDLQLKFPPVGEFLRVGLLGW